MSRFPITAISLALLNVALAFAAVLLWTHGQERVKEPATLIVPPLLLPDLAALNSTPMPSVDVATIRNEAAFYATRTFYQPPPAPVQVAPPEYDMAGSLRLLDGKRIAFVKRRSDRSSRTLHLGDDVDGWHVRVIETDRIVLEHDEQIAELRGNTPSGASGLVRSAGPPPVAQSGLHILGATGTGSSRVAGPGSFEARIYHAPPPVGK